MSSIHPHLPSSDRRARPLEPHKWPGDPVFIPVPSNDHRHIQEPAPTSTRSRNPFDRPSSKQQRSIGNTTSRSTLVQKGPSMTSSPSAKRRRLDNHSPPSANSKESPFLVTDDDDPLNFLSGNITRQSRDRFPSDTGLKSSGNMFTLVDDGHTYTQMASGLSDPIEEFPLGVTHESGRRLVSERVENIGTYQKVDLHKESLKRGMKSRSKGNGNGLSLRPVLITRKQPDKIPVHSCFINEILWKSTPQQRLWMYTQNGHLFIQENSREIANEPINAYTMHLAKPSEVEMSSVPTIQFKSGIHHLKTMTIRLDTQFRWSENGYTEFVQALNDLAFDVQFMRSEHTPRLWEMAEQNAAVQGKNTHTHETSATRLELKNLNPPLSSTATASLKRKADLDPPDAPHGFKSSSSRHKHNHFPTERNLRSRKNAAPDIEPISSALANPDEVVLSYPAGLPGAVNITNIDLERLSPGAFLNDTLIEFGLKVWLKDLETSNPNLADQIHVFSSFFYKKLNSKKDLQAAYESVRKWTNKFDIFRKRYIIVPINEHLHWYLAIIYEPEHVLKDPPVVNHKSPPRPQTRLFTAHAISEIDSNSSTIDQRIDTQIEDLEPRSEIEIERDLKDFEASCTIEDHPLPQPDSNSDICEPLSRSADDAMASSRSTLAVTSAKGRRSLNTVKPERFYRSPSIQRQNGKKKTGTKLPGMCVDPNERDEIEILDTAPKTYIFTFDSLGSRHPQALKRLSAYLRMEAKYKKGVDCTGTMEGKNAQVPCQTNFCDCGIYLLHFARTFMSNPEKYTDIILAPRSKSTDTERKAIWLVDQDFEPHGREKLRLRIEALSKDWREFRDGAQKQSEPIMNGDEESDGEVELVESDTGNHSKSSRKSQLQGQKTGPASRVRG